MECGMGTLGHCFSPIMHCIYINVVLSSTASLKQEVVIRVLTDVFFLLLGSTDYLCL